MRASAFPEVLLGLHPGLGGTVRSTRLINPMQAMTMMLTGKTERARAAKSLGLVDAVTQERHVRAAVKAAVAGELKAARQSLLGRLLDTAPARAVLAWRMRGEAEKKAPRRELSGAVRAHRSVGDPWRRRRRDAQGGDRVVRTAAGRRDLAQNLVRVFFLRNKLKGLAGAGWDGRRVHVIGAGAMGGDIAAWCAWHGFTVSLADMKPAPLAGAIKRAAELYGKIGHRDRRAVRDALDRLIPDLTGRASRPPTSSSRRCRRRSISSARSLPASSRG